jgi:hypothetical protein
VSAGQTPPKRQKRPKARSVTGFLRHPKHDFAVFVLAVLLAVATDFGASSAHRHAPVVRNVSILGNVSVLSDSQVTQALKADGWSVTSKPSGATVIVTHPQEAREYQLAYMPDQIVAIELQDQLKRSGEDSESTVPFGSRLAVETDLTIAQALSKRGLAAQEPDGTWLFNVQAYVTAVNDRLTWAGVPGGSALSSGPVLLSTPAPHVSAIGQQFAALASYALNGDHLVTGQATAQRINRELRPLFDEQGQMQTGAIENFSAPSFSSTLYYSPLRLIYENQYLQPELAGGQTLRAMKSQHLVLMYLNPEAIAENTLVGLTGNGDTVSQLFDSPPIANIAQNKYGFITSTGQSAFATAMRSHGLSAPGPLTTDIQYPSSSVLSTLLANLGPN